MRFARYAPPLLATTAAMFFSSCGDKDVQTAAETSADKTEKADLTPPHAAPASQNIQVSANEPLSFNDHVQPILSEYCYHCHGPDSGSRKPDVHPLRLDRAEFAFEERPDGGRQPIVKGDSSASEIIARMHSTDPNLVMPPPEMHKKMKPKDIAILERWIDEGAEYEEHWSFIAPQRPDVPQIDDAPAGWDKNPIDAFILAKMRSKGLTPNPQEDPARLLRRLSFDATGLAPAADEVEAFVAAMAEQPNIAYADKVDSLLTTQAHAEQLTRHWLDAVRYADTHGIHIDNYRSIWPYRDWVLKAYSENMPFDQFTIEQLGGDLLPDASISQVVATGYNRCLPTTGEGGAIREEYEAIYAQDRTDTTSGVWLGLTMGCAACHDHKFDPISQKDVYAFNAFFRNTTMDAMDLNDSEHAPATFAPRLEDYAAWDSVQKEKREIDAAREAHRKEAAQTYTVWKDAVDRISPPAYMADGLGLHLPLDHAGDIITGQHDGQSITIDAPSLNRQPGPFGPGLSLDGVNLALGDYADYSFKDTFTVSAWVYFDENPSGDLISRADKSQRNKGWRIGFSKRNLTININSNANQSAISGRGLAGLNRKQWNHIAVTFDGGRPSYSAITFYVNGERSGSRFSRAALSEDFRVDAPLHIGGMHGGDPLKGNVGIQDLRIYDRRLTNEELQLMFSSGKAAEQLADVRSGGDKDDQLREHFVRYAERGAADLTRQLIDIERRALPMIQRGSQSLIMDEKEDQQPFAHILNRGVYSDLGEKVLADVPEVLPPLPDGAPANRLGLGKWLVARDNPLTARVTMNRLWYYIYGEGLVTSIADFGIMGARPSHPKLLDWLAVEFMDSGWDYRHMVRLMLNSATYRQSSKVRAENVEIDSANTYLSRGPRQRLEAEQIRDHALAAADLLRLKVGGPSVKPYQPEGIWESVAMNQSNTRFYSGPTDTDELYRRSLYTFWKRTAPHPAMEILNAPTREVFCVKRDITNTPLQAFVTLNDPQFIEASRALADNALAASDDFDGRLDFITMRLLSRTLAEDSREIVRSVLDDVMTTYSDNTDAAKELISVGETTSQSGADAATLAAWTIVTSKIFNLDENLNK